VCGVFVVVAGAGGARARDAALELSVAQAVEFALRDGVEAAIAREDVRAAEAIVGVARSYALPSIDAVGTYTRNIKKPVIFFEFEPGEIESFEIGQDNAWLGALTLRQTLLAFGRVRSGYNSAREMAAAARLAGDDAALAIARDVKTAYYLAVLAAAQSDIARRSLVQSEQTVAQIGGRVAQGVTPRFDMLRAEVTLANRRPLVTRAENGETIALESLKRLLGVPLDRPVVLTDTLAFAPFADDADAVVERALVARRDLAAVRRQASAAEFRLKAQAANDRPLLQLDGNFTWQGETSDELWPGDRESASSAGVGLSLSWPLFDGFRNKNQTREAHAGAARATLRVRQMEEVVRLEARSSHSEVQSIAQEIAGARRTVELARDAYDIARVRYETGLSTLVEYQDAELAYIQASLYLSETLFRYNVALARLEYNIGEGPGLAP
jgi:outer membrane protein TolC